MRAKVLPVVGEVDHGRAQRHQAAGDRCPRPDSTPTLVDSSDSGTIDNGPPINPLRDHTATQNTTLPVIKHTSIASWQRASRAISNVETAKKMFLNTQNGGASKLHAQERGLIPEEIVTTQPLEKKVEPAPAQVAQLAPTSAGSHGKGMSASSSKLGNPLGATLSQMFVRRFSVLPESGAAMREMRNNEALSTRTGSSPKERKSSRYIIHPFSPFRWHWDLVMVFLIVYTVVAIPTAVAFFAEGMDPVWFGFSVWVDIMYIIDVFLNFRTGVVTVSDAPEVILDSREIACRYLKGSFLIDFVSSIPLDHLTVLVQGGNPREASVWSTTSTLKVLRFARLLSLLRLLKVTRLFRSMRKLQEYLNIGPGLLRIMNLIFVMLLVAHWNGCIQFFFARAEGFPEESWVVLHDLQDATVGEQYAWSIFKALSHMLCIGYGQEPPITYTECWITIWSMLIGATFYAMFLALMSSHISSLDASKQVYGSKLAALNDFMVSKRVPSALRSRVHDYFDEHCARQKMFDEDTILSCLSPSLRLEIVKHCRSPVFNTVPLLQELKPHISEAIATLLQLRTVIPGDVIVRQGQRGSDLFLIQYGEFVVTVDNGVTTKHEAANFEGSNCSGSYEVALLSDGDIFGEISFLDPSRMRNATVTATAPGRLFCLPQDHFSLVCKDAPELLRRVRCTAVERITHNSVVTC